MIEMSTNIKNKKRTNFSSCNTVFHVGEPSTDHIFNDIRNSIEDPIEQPVGVFFAGKRKFGKTVKNLCKEYTENKDNYTFNFHPELLL